RAQVLEVGRQREPLAEVLDRFVGREAGADRRDLEEDAARLAEVDRLEVEAVDDRRHVRPRGRDALAPGLVLLRRRGPGDVVHGARTANAGTLGGGVVFVETAPPLASRLPAVVAGRSELERLLEKLPAALGIGRERPHA